jgi:methionine S-methyltransferase
VYGLDINPRAIKVAWINLFLNALNEEGSPVLDHEGKTLLDRVEFHVSDLLAYCREHNLMLDRIIGCIPQILNPDPGAMSKIVSENASEEFLYSLSNYCGLQVTPFSLCFTPLYGKAESKCLMSEYKEDSVIFCGCRFWRIVS